MQYCRHSFSTSLLPIHLPRLTHATVPEDSCTGSSAFAYDETNTAIGPVANLTITNQIVAPDGFSRAAVAVNGGTLGPLIVGNKVRSHILYGHRYANFNREQHLPTQGDRFLINVTDNLTNHTMNMTTSIVGAWRVYHLVVHLIVNVIPWGPTALARLLPEGHDLGRRDSIREPVSDCFWALVPVRLHRC